MAESGSGVEGYCARGGGRLEHCMHMYVVDGTKRTFSRFADLFAEPLETPFPVLLLNSGSRSILGKYFQKRFFFISVLFPGLSLFVPSIACRRYYMSPKSHSRDAWSHAAENRRPFLFLGFLSGR